jgi:chromosome segregation ATPase
MLHGCLTSPSTDKTAHFSQQIEEKQQELQPWADKAAEKQASIDVMTSERNLLAEKTASVGRAIEEVEASLAQIVEESDTKKARLEELKEERKAGQKDIERAQANLQVSEILPVIEVRKLIKAFDSNSRVESRNSAQKYLPPVKRPKKPRPRRSPTAPREKF